MRDPSIDDDILVSSSPPSGSGLSSAAKRDVDDEMSVDCKEHDVVKAVACAIAPKNRHIESFILLRNKRQ